MVGDKKDIIIIMQNLFTKFNDGEELLNRDKNSNLWGIHVL